MTHHRQLILLNALHFIHTGGKAVTLPFLPLFLYYRGFDSVEIGMIMGVAPMVSIVAQPIAGYISDKYKTIKKLLIILNFIVIATGIGVFFPEQFTIVFASVILMHFAMSPGTPLIDSMTLHSLKDNKSDYGKIRMWGSVGFAIIAVASGPILQALGIHKLYILFWFIGLVTLFLYLFLKDENQSATPVNLRSVGELFTNFPFVWALFLAFIMMIPHRVNDTMIVLHMENLGATTFLIGLAWALAALSEVPVFYYLTQKITQYRDLVLLGIVATFYTVRWLLYSFIESAWLITALQVMQGLTFGLFWIVVMQLAVRSVPDHLRSTGQAVLGSICFGIGGAIGGTAGGWVFDHWGSTAMYLIMASFTAFAALLLFASHFVSERRVTKR